MAKKVRVFSCVGGAGAQAFWAAWLSELQKAGFYVDEVFAASSERYRWSHSFWARLRLRFRMYFGMLFCLLRSGVFAPRGSVLIVTTNPFYAPWILAQFAAWRCKVIHLVYDLYPESLVAAGKIKPHGIVARALSALTRAALTRSHAVVFLGDRIRQYAAEKYGVALKKTRVVPVGADCSAFAHTPSLTSTSLIEILYCGNLGMLHQTESLVHSLVELDQSERDRFHFRFCASGSGMRDLARTVEQYGLSKWFTYSGPLDHERWQETMATAPIGLVLLKESAVFSAVPSKVYSAMAAGQAILAICRTASDLGSIVLNHDCGWVVDPGDTALLADTLRRIWRDPASIDEKRNNAYRAACQHYCMPVVTRPWTELIESV